MKNTAILVALAACSPLLCSAAAVNAKRGLVYIPNATTPQDNSIWIQSGSDLSWYYTYNDSPNSQYTGKLEFVPMMWGMGSNQDDNSFYKSVAKQKNNGADIKYALSFNEPDLGFQSNLSANKAAHGYVANFMPLRKLGIKTGLPAVSGSSLGIQWLRNFRDNCTALVQEKGVGTACEYDFLPSHWYDNFGGLKAHVLEAVKEFPDTKIWVTEFAYAHQNLNKTQDYYNQAVAWLDGYDKIERYSYFGAFRSDVSNAGPNVTFLNTRGQLTDIGSLYLGGQKTGVVPTS